jgi:hypothetical protein
MKVTRNTETIMTRIAQMQSAGSENLMEYCNDRDEIDLRNLDVRALTPEQWSALKKHIIWHAQIERAKAIRGLFGGIFFRRGRKMRLARAMLRLCPTS